MEIQHRPRNPNANRTPEQQKEINAKISLSLLNSPAKRKNPGGPSKAPREERTCDCGNTFIVIQSKTQRYCSRSCARMAAAILKSQQTEQAWYDSEKSLCPCGKNIPYANRNEWKYCSSECRNQYGKKKQANPENYVTFDCQNCGQSVTRYKKYGNGYNKFCSNQCAAKHTKIKHHIAFKDDDVLLDSTWEGLFWCLLSFAKIPVERTDRSLAVQWQEGHWYAPDFYLPSQHLYVEIKGVEDEEDSDKWDFWRQQRGPLLVLGQEDLDQIRRLENFHNYFADQQIIC